MRLIVKAKTKDKYLGFDDNIKRHVVLRGDGGIELYRQMKIIEPDGCVYHCTLDGKCGNVEEHCNVNDVLKSC